MGLPGEKLFTASLPHKSVSVYPSFLQHSMPFRGITPEFSARGSASRLHHVWNRCSFYHNRVKRGFIDDETFLHCFSFSLDFDVTIRTGCQAKEGIQLSRLHPDGFIKYHVSNGGHVINVLIIFNMAWWMAFFSNLCVEDLAKKGVRHWHRQASDKMLCRIGLHQMLGKLSTVL